MRVAVAGLGRVTYDLHLPAIKRLGEAELVAGFDPSPAARESWRRRTRTTAHEALAELLSEARPELVIVAAPPGSHADLAVEALEAGAHVLCEKPLAPGVAEADRILAAAGAAGRGVSVDHNLRTMPIFAALRERIATRRHGRLLLLQAWQLIDLPPWEDPRPWSAEHPDRTLLEAGIHAIDLILFLFGAAPVAVTARQASGGGPPGADAISLVALEFADGGLAQLSSNHASPTAARHLDLRADCERASLRASIGGRALLEIGKKRARRAGLRLELGGGGTAWLERGLKRKTIARNRRVPARQATERLLAATIDAFEGGGDPPCSGLAARQAVGVVEASYRSAQGGERVQLASADQAVARSAPNSS